MSNSFCKIGASFTVMDSLCVLHWNAGGLSQAKKVEIENICRDKNVDIFSLVEANVTKETLQRFKFKGYNLFCLEKNRQVASGILVGIKSTLTSRFTVVKQMGIAPDKTEIVKIECWKGNGHFRIFSLYSPPGNKPNFDVLNISKRTLILGDFNAHTHLVGYKDENFAGKELEGFIDSHQVELVYKSSDCPSYMHYNGTLSNPDVVIASSDISQRVKRVILEDPGFGHRVILTSAYIHQNGYKKKQIKTRTTWNFKKANWPEFQSILEDRLRKDIIFKNDISLDGANQTICNIILEAARKSIPLSKSKKFRPFWNEQLQNLKKKRDQARILAESTGKKEDIGSWRAVARDLKLKINESKTNVWNDFITSIDYKKDGQKLYKFMATLTNRFQEQRKEPIMFRNKQMTDDKKIAEAFVKFYADKQKRTIKMKKEERILKRLIGRINPEDEDICCMNFTMNELKFALEKQKIKKCPGPDNIHAEFLKHLGTEALETLLTLYNWSWNSYVPAAWRKSIIIPIPKKDKTRQLPENYRPISLNSIIGKIMERMVNERLNFYLEHYDHLTEIQSGFRVHRSTNQQVIRLSQAIKDSLDKSETLVAVFVDFRAAYDRIWRVNLIYKLKSLGISNKMLQWIKNAITQRFCAVRYGSETSGYKQIHCGLPQGGITSTSLFNVYINDLPDRIKGKIKDIECALYADDLVIWTSAPRKHTDKIVLRINKALEALYDWSMENQMEVNIDKTMYQTFTLNHQPTSMDLNYNGNSIRETEEAVYLGVKFDKKLTWQRHLDSVIDRARKRLTVLKRLAGVKWGCGRDTLNKTYNLYIKPLITYCCEALITSSNTCIQKLEVFQNEALRLITGAVKTTPVDAMLYLTNNKPMEVIIQEKALVLYEKLIRLPSSEIWRNYNISRPRRLKTQSGFLQKVFELKTEYSLLGVPAEELLKPVNPIHLGSISNECCLTNAIKKSSSADYELHAAALETIHTKYPANKWIHIYTDGSKMMDNVGVGVYSELFAFYTSLGPFRTNFDGELEAIRIATEQIGVRTVQLNKIVIFSDSLSAIQAISAQNVAESKIIDSCRKNLDLLAANGKNVVLQWIPSHVGINGNEWADKLAKKGTEILQVNNFDVPFSSIKRIIRNTMRKNFDIKLTERILNKKWKESIRKIPDSPRSAAVAAFRLEVGHDCLAKHLHRIGIFNSPLCTLCNQNFEMDKDHLLSCPSLNEDDMYSRYWRAREMMQLTLYD